MFETAWQRFLWQAGVNALTACVLAFCHGDTLLTALLLVPLIGFSLWLHRRSAAMMWMFGLMVVMGLAGEVWAVHWGVWRYETLDFLGIPLYIGLAWGLMALFMASLHQALKEWLDD